MLFKPTIWLVGRSGRLGSALETTLSKNLDYRLIATDEAEVDIRHLDEVEGFIEKIQPDIVINCAAKSDKAWCEDHPEDSYALHALGARNLATVADHFGAHLFYLSTDFVFDGRSQKPYTEFDFPQPNTVYGASKLAGEEFIKSLCTKYTILRCSWLYGKRYLNEILANARQGQVTIHRDIIGSPTSSLEVAERVIDFFGEKEYGTFHISCEGEASLRAFVQKVLDEAGIQADIIEGDVPSRFESLRPPYSVLDNMMLRLTQRKPMAQWEAGLVRFMNERKVASNQRK